MIKSPNGKSHVPVILLDSSSEVLEFTTLKEAEEMQMRFQVNSDSGYVYYVKKIGER